MAGQNNSDEELTKHNAVLLHVEHQEGLYTGARDIATLELKHNVTGRTKAALVPEIPIEVTTTTESMWGPMIPELASALTNHDVIEQTVNAWDEPRVVQAVCATGRKHLIVTGISTDVCLASPATAALRDGYTSYAVADGSGGSSQTQVNPSVTRMVQAGIIPVDGRRRTAR